MASEFGLVGHKLAGVHQKFHLAIPAIEFFSFIGRTPLERGGKMPWGNNARH